MMMHGLAKFKASTFIVLQFFVRWIIYEKTDKLRFEFRAK